MLKLQLTEFAKYCNDLIRKDIQYEGNDSEKEKQQGRALSERQKVCRFYVFQNYIRL